MIDQRDFGKRILEARKAQGLTQEQLGNVIGVSSQAVSKWELGESVPDMTLLPDLCRALAVSADLLLGTEDAIGIETLCRLLVERINASAVDSQDAHLTLIFRRLLKAGSKVNPDYDNIFSRYKGNGVAVVLNREQSRLVGARILETSGLACFVPKGMLERDADPELVEAMRVVTAPVQWRIFNYLVGGPQKRDAILQAGIVADDKEFDAAIQDLINTGIVAQRRSGYGLDDDHRLTAVLVALRALSSVGRHLVTSINVPSLPKRSQETKEPEK